MSELLVLNKNPFPKFKTSNFALTDLNAPTEIVLISNDFFSTTPTINITTSNGYKKIKLNQIQILGPKVAFGSYEIKLVNVFGIISDTLDIVKKGIIRTEAEGNIFQLDLDCEVNTGEKLVMNYNQTAAAMLTISYGYE